MFIAINEIATILRCHLFIPHIKYLLECFQADIINLEIDVILQDKLVKFLTKKTKFNRHVSVSWLVSYCS